MQKIKYFAVAIILAMAGLLAGFFVCNNYFVKSKVSVPVVTHYSYFSQADFFNNSYTFAKAQNYNADAKGILVNHHLLVGNFIAEAFNKIATNAPVTILLVSPNHFSAGKDNFIFSNAQWQTPYGILEPDSKSLAKLSDANLSSLDESPFNQEHGISGIVAFIKKSLPNAKVIPLIIRNNVSVDTAKKVADEYYKLLPKNTLVVASFDFSHYLTHQAADFHDLESLNDVQNFNYSEMGRLDIDSRPGLVFSQRLLEDYGANKFNLLEHSNSASVTHQENTLETTSYITGYFSSELVSQSASQKSVVQVDTILALPPILASTAVGGSLNRYSKNWSVEYLERLFTGQDKTIVQISDSQNILKQQLKHYGFTDILDTKDIGDIMDIGNNVTIHEHAKVDSITVKNNQIIINRKNNLLSGDVLKNGGVSVAYGFAVSNNNLNITIMPIGAENGDLKLLVGKQSDIVLVDIVKNSSSAIGEEIKSGKILINNLK